jgi:spermidine synthase
MSRPNKLILSCVCLFLSGVASLIYELVWIRQLVLVYGATLYAISAVLCAYMSGLALGAWGVSKILHGRWFAGGHGKPRSLIRAYALTELAIGLYALALPFGLNLLETAYPWAVKTFDQSPLAFHLVEFLGGTLLMLPATFLMGATLPMLGSWVIGDRAEELLADVSRLYGINTAGAVVGCLFAQFVGIRYFGIDGVTGLAVGLNVLVCLLCLLVPNPLADPQTHIVPEFARPLQKSVEDLDSPAPSRLLTLLVFFIFAYSGMASLAGEILWTRVLLFPMGSTLYSFALILAAFLTGIALGSLIADKIRGPMQPTAKFLLLEIAIGVVCIALLPAFDHMTEWTQKADRLLYDEQNTALRTLAFRSAFAFGFLLLPTIGFGMAFPIANKLHARLFLTSGRTLGNCYAINTLGAVFGTLLTPFLFIPAWGIRGSLFILYAVLILLSVIAWTLHRQSGPFRAAALLCTTILLMWGAYNGISPHVRRDLPGQGNFARIEFNTPPEQIRLLDYHEGDHATLSVVEDAASGSRTLYVDGFSTATVSGSVGGSAYMQAMGFIPMILHPDPKRVLVICFGTGNTLGAVSQFPQTQADGVEIDSNVLQLAHWFSRWNHDVLQRKNVGMFVQDGRRFLRWTENTYDVITLEPMSPVQAGVNNLYSREFYESASRHLAPDGIMLQWLPLHLVTPEDARAILKTFQEVFPHTSVWNSFLTRIVLLVGSKNPHAIDKARFEQAMANPDVHRLAEQIGVNSFLDFTDFFLADGRQAAPLIQNASVITDNRPLLEFSEATLLPPLPWQTDESFLNLLRHRAEHLPEVRNLTEEESAEWRAQFALRSAQRFAIFSQRYEGPGKDDFTAKAYSPGMDAVRQFLKQNDGKLISLENRHWRAAPYP